MSLAILVAEAVGFGHSAHQRIAEQIAFSRSAIVHATLFSSWILVFCPQTVLVATHRVQVHRRLDGARMSRVSIWGGIALLMSIPARFSIAQTSAWHHLALLLAR